MIPGLVLFWQTTRGLLGSMLILCSLVATGALLLAWQFTKMRTKMLLSSGLVVATGTSILVYLVATAPDNIGPGIQRHNPNSPRFHPLNLIPEVDQVSWALALSRHLGLLPAGLQKNLDQSVLPLYQAPEIQHLGSSTVHAWSDLFGGDPGNGDILYYVPPGSEKAPVIIFLHGSMGNFHSHLVVLRKFCDQHGYALVSPTYGAGLWYRPEAASVVENALDFATRELPIDPSRVVLVSFSNGTFGALEAARRQPNRYLGIFSISGCVSGVAPEIPLFLLHGEVDRLVPLKAVKEWAQLNGVEVTSIPDQDHSLFYADQSKVLAHLARLLEKCNP